MSDFFLKNKTFPVKNACFYLKINDDDARVDVHGHD